MTATGLWSPATLADPPPIALRMSVVRMEDATSCPTAEALREDLARRSLRSWTEDSASPSLEVLFGGLPAHWTAQVYLRTTAQPHPEALHFVEGSASCDGIARLVVQAVLDAMIPHESAPPPPPPSSSAPRRDRTRAPSIALEATGTLGLVPTFAGGATATADFGFFGPIHVAVHAGGVVEQSTNVTATGTASFGLASVAAVVCIDPVHLAAVQLAVCGGPMVGVIHASTQNLPTTTSSENAWLSGELSARVSVPVSAAFFLTAGVAGDALLVRNRFHVDGVAAPIFEQSVISATGSVGAGTWF